MSCADFSGNGPHPQPFPPRGRGERDGNQLTNSLPLGGKGGGWGPSTWQIHDIGADRTLVLLPGWATDARIFAGLEIRYNTIMPQVRERKTGTVPFFRRFSGKWGLSPFFAALATLLRDRTTPTTLVGWSLGGFAAADFARQYPELVSRLILVGVRHRFPLEQIAARRQALREDRARCLADFYRQCFLPAQRADFRRFHAELEPAYLREFSAEALEAGLDYLETVELSAETLPACPITLVHGEQDIIAPVEEARELAGIRPPIPQPLSPRGARGEADLAGLGGRITLHVLPAGHAAFLHPEFLTILHDA
ncbi:MAG: alpha/beta fold hydrolase [Armatimonadota bacterium]